MLSIKQLNLILKLNNAVHSGESQKEGWYVRVNDALNGDFDKKEYFKHGAPFPGSEEWVMIADEQSPLLI